MKFSSPALSRRGGKRHERITQPVLIWQREPPMKCFRIMDNVLEWIVFVCSFGFAVLCIFQIFFRVIVNDSIPWSEEASRYLFVQVVFFGGIICVNEKLHTGVDLLVQVLPFQTKRYHSIAICALMFVFCMYLMVSGCQIAMKNMYQISSALRIPIGYVYLCIPLSGLFMGINCIRVAYRDWTRTYAPRSLTSANAGEVHHG